MTRLHLTLLAALSTLSVANVAQASAQPPGPTNHPGPPVYANLAPIPDPLTHSWTRVAFPTLGQMGYGSLLLTVQNKGQADAPSFNASVTFYRYNAIPFTVVVPFNGGIKKGFFAYQFVPLPYGWGADANGQNLKFVIAVDSSNAVTESNELDNFQAIYAPINTPAP